MKKTLLAMAALAAISGSVLAAANAQVPATPVAQGVHPCAAGQTINGYTDGQAYYNEHCVRMGKYMHGYTDGQAYYNEHCVRMGQYMQANAR
ncbi:MAG: hypothetical protein KIB01_01515 [Negativicoccus succinicivorans]|uniref:Opacity protein-like surface antigen n=2 Tax=Negativicoccus succinicivorans TaxID=620903 RepID=A0A841R3W4_9FIRM|nr:hypothetical protein [Negativicoccus succinicivorans]KGF12070.1 hypothetical protein HMPREF1633_02855 [Tissierellia bacterium S5-A11]MBB6477760.1 opacity protein-like surface antigen [Negativicoccus succinicivorans]MBS5917039.1 hypothetical protein [Negativicoccus succinicivorans]MDU2183445.1 hypothetical protein [Negativicoccus succinicivorans]MDU2643394.1 hypothetical protein [Negativicoccus succinicivorans]